MPIPVRVVTNNPGSKPSIMEHVRDLDEIGRTFQAYLKDGKVPVDLAVLFLHAYAKKLVTFAIDKDWKICSVNIATNGETISPLNLLKVDEASDNGTDKKEHSYKEEHSHWIAMFILSVFRIGRVQNDYYKEKLKLKIVAQMKHL